MTSRIEPGAVIDGKYRVLRRIGEGGMGTVYEGENVRIERRVAIKVLHAHVASSPEFASRFEREARASARIGSPHVCDVLDLGDFPNGERFIVMEYLDGESLEERLERGTLTAGELAPIAFEILDGLGSMHQAGVIHRDLKPANVFLAKRPGRSDTVKILDFGVAKIVPRADEPGEMTSTGMMMGTPLYMSPEQARGARDVDGRTDLYAASVIFYRALTGVVPHSAENLHELLFKIVLEEPPPILTLAPSTDEAFAALVTKGLARDADARYASAREYQEAIAAWASAAGRTSSVFAITLPNEPPPLRQITGGFPSARIRATQPPQTGPQPEVPAAEADPGDESPKEPVVVASAKTQNTPSAASTRLGEGTPTAWAEDAPEIAKRALAEVAAKRATPASPKTEVMKSDRPPPRASTPPRAPEASPPKRSALAAVAVFAVVGMGALGLALSRSKPMPAAESAASSAPIAVEPRSTPLPSASSAEKTPIPAVTAPPDDSPPIASSTQGPGAAPSAAPKSTVPTNLPVAVSAVPAPAKSAPIASAVPAKTAAPTAPTGSGRKFRTNLE